MFKRNYYSLGAALTMGMIAASTDANAAATGKSFSTIAGNIATSIQDLPGLISGLAYLFGSLIGVLGIMKIKDHVENPTQTPLKDGAIRLAAGGGLFALPIIYDAMFTTIGTGTTADVAKLNKVKLGI